jgi:hypothetical protein
MRFKKLTLTVDEKVVDSISTIVGAFCVHKPGYVIPVAIPVRNFYALEHPTIEKNGYKKIICSKNRSNFLLKIYGLEL